MTVIRKDKIICPFAHNLFQFERSMQAYPEGRRFEY